MTLGKLSPKAYALWEEFFDPKTKWMEWSSFQKLFVNHLNFGFMCKGGSITEFSYPAPSRKFFIVHQPHGGPTTLGPHALRMVRERLKEDLGWSISSFRPQ